MATVKPTKVPRWNDTGGNRTEPPESGPGTSKDVGWQLNDQPPSSYFNWLQFYTGDWLRWLNERLFDGTTTIDFKIQAIDGESSGVDGGDVLIYGGAGNGAADGGIVSINGGVGNDGGGGIFVNSGDGGASGAPGGLIKIESGFGFSGAAGGEIRLLAGAGNGAEGGDINITAGVSDFDGGDVSVTGGAGTSAADGGDVSITGGSASGSGGAGGDVNISSGASSLENPGDVNIGAAAATAGTYEGGDVNITGGDSLGNGGDVNITGGDVVGTNKTGGSVIISTGASTGSAGAEVLIKASTADVSGSGVNTPETYIDCGGLDRTIRLEKRTVFTWNTDGTAPIRVFSRSSEPTSKSFGDIYVDSRNDQLAFYDGARFKNLDPFVHYIGAMGQWVTGDGVNNYFALKDSGGGLISYTIPANTLRVGTKIEGDLYLDHGGSNTESFGIEMAIGTSIAATWVSAPGSRSLLIGTKPADRYFSYTRVRYTIIITAVGGSGVAAFHASNTVNNDMAIGKVGLTGENEIDFRSVTTGLDTTVQNYIFPYLNLSNTEQGRCQQFTVGIT